MARTVKIKSGKDTLFVENQKDGEIQFYKAQEVGVDNPLVSQVISNDTIRNSILVSLFLRDTEERSHQAVAKSLGTTANHVTMMKYHWKVEGRSPTPKRLEYLEKYYKMPSRFEKIK